MKDLYFTPLWMDTLIGHSYFPLWIESAKKILWYMKCKCTFSRSFAFLFYY